MQQTAHAIDATAEIVLRINGAAKTYHGLTGASAALLPVTADIRAGEFVSLVGPSGCGKTTLLKMCAGLITPSSGSITFANTGKNIQPELFGFVFQAAALLAWRDVLSNVTLPADILGLNKVDTTARARQLLAMVRLAGAEHKYPRELSGGMQQRAAIARALLHDPDILFMDEPFGALDAMTREELNMELQRISREQRKTVLFVTHDIEEAVLLSDRVLALSAGPGRLVDVIDIPLQRPRSFADKGTPEFQQAVTRIRALLGRGGAH